MKNSTVRIATTSPYGYSSSPEEENEDTIVFFRKPILFDYTSFGLTYKRSH
ncbi:hypothetical protein [Bacteroides rodentium]